jgi:uncharacterized membrane protein
MKHPLRIIATLGLAAYVYGELATYVYPFVLLPHLGLSLQVMPLTFFAAMHDGTNFGWRDGLLMFFATPLVRWSFEQVGVLTEAAYGAYHYLGMLGPKLGAVPLLIPVVWFMMIYPSYLVPSVIVDGQPFPQKTDMKRLGTRAVIAIVVMTAWSAVMDQRMLQAGFWIWEQGGSYFGVPGIISPVCFLKLLRCISLLVCCSSGSNRP